MKKINYSLLLLILLSSIIPLGSALILNLDDLIYQNLSHRLTEEQVNSIYDLKDKWEWLSYTIIPLILILKISIIAAIIDIGCFFFNVKLKYKTIFKIVTKAEFIFLGVIICKTLWFYFFKDNYTLEDLQYFYPLSAINITGYENLASWWVYPLQVFNFFELAYWFMLAYLIGKQLNVSTDKGFSIIASSYGVSLLIWVVGMMFFTLNMS